MPAPAPSLGCGPPTDHTRDLARPIVTGLDVDVEQGFVRLPIVATADDAFALSKMSRKITFWSGSTRCAARRDRSRAGSPPPYQRRGSNPQETSQTLSECRRPTTSPRRSSSISQWKQPQHRQGRPRCRPCGRGTVASGTPDTGRVQMLPSPETFCVPYPFMDGDPVKRRSCSAPETRSTSGMPHRLDGFPSWPRNLGTRGLVDVEGDCRRRGMANSPSPVATPVPPGR